MAQTLCKFFRVFCIDVTYVQIHISTFYISTYNVCPGMFSIKSHVIQLYSMEQIANQHPYPPSLSHSSCFPQIGNKKLSHCSANDLHLNGEITSQSFTIQQGFFSHCYRKSYNENHIFFMTQLRIPVYNLSWYSLTSKACSYRISPVDIEHVLLRKENNNLAYFS